jgi:light-regulated signal transduction histidine kinase (bacteriophytochrome)
MFRRLCILDKYEKTEIGLTIVKKVVEQYSSWVWVESTPDRGSTFFFTLPAA